MFKQVAKFVGVGIVIMMLSLMTTVLAYAHTTNQADSQHQQEDEQQAYLGVQVRDGETGALVVYVFPDSAAEAAGIEIDDIVVAFNDTEITTGTDLVREVGKAEPGDSVVITVQRGAESIELTAELMGEAPFDDGAMIFHSEPITLGGIPWPGRGENGRGPIFWGGYEAPLQLGVSYTSLTPEIAATEEVSVDEGALITEVLEDTPAADAGLEVGDVITAVDGDAVDIEHTLSDRLFAYEAEDQVMLTVQRDGETLEIGVVLASEHPAKQNRFGWGTDFIDIPWMGEGDALPWLNGDGPIQIEMVPGAGVHMGDNIMFEMSSEPPALDAIPEDASVYECAMPNGLTMYFTTTEEMDDLPGMMACVPYTPDMPEVETIEG